MIKAKGAQSSSELRFSKTNLKRFDAWIGYLLRANSKPETQKILFNYFYDQFAVSQKSFYQFLQYYKFQLDHHPQKKNLARKYLDVLSPLCERFNSYGEKNVLNNKCFRLAEKEEYKRIKDTFASYEKNSHKFMRAVLKQLDEALRDTGIKYEIIGRCKNIYSLYKKIRKKEKNIPEINDIFAFRIIIDSTYASQCYRVVNVLHDTFLPNPGLFKDYIAIPKINGYQSIHTGLEKVVPGLDIPVEVQIRTREMHEFAEEGLAAHWMYSRYKNAQSLLDYKKNLVNLVFSRNKFNQEPPSVHCFTRHGDIVKLKKDSTIIDFAYRIHTGMGHRTAYAMVDGKKKPVHYRIRDGQRIEIVQDNSDKISIKWLKYAKTKNAIKKIQSYFRPFV